MAMKKNFAKTYANTAVDSIVSEATPHKLVEMLYENLLKNLKLSKIFLEQENHEKKSQHVNKSLAILAELKSNLDLENGKDVAGNLNGLYDYCYQQIVKSSVENNNMHIDEVVSLLEPIHDAWKAMPEQFKRASKEQLNRMRNQ